MRFKVDDLVRIKSIDWYNENKDEYGVIYTSVNCNFYADRSKYCGKVFTIHRVFNNSYLVKEDNGDYYWTDEMIEGLVEEETKFGTASNPLEPKSNANCLTRERVDALATKIDKELPFGNQYVWELPDGYQFTDENGNVINATKIVLEKKKKEYPKTYDECCKVLNIAVRDLDILDNMLDTTEIIYNKNLDRLLNSFRKLLICRDAYWKIAGDEMGLGKPWKPNDSSGYCTYAILRHTGHIRKSRPYADSELLEFPTEEMRDAFYENFKELINECKELL